MNAATTPSPTAGASEPRDPAVASGNARSGAPPRRDVTTTSARTAPIEYTRTERLRDRLETPVRLPRLPRPPVRRLLASIPGMIPAPVASSRPGRLAARHPALAAWLVVFTGLGILIAAHEPAVPHPEIHQARYQKWLQRKGAQTIRVALAEIGPSVKIPSVHAEPVGEDILGFYTIQTGEITFNSKLEYHPLQMLETAAHECVHGIVVQNRLTPPDSFRDDYLVMVNEVAAYVLGAHITGAALARDGYDGSIVTEILFQRYRNACDPTTPDSVFRRYLVPDAVQSRDIAHEEWLSIFVHFGAPLQLVDEVHEICHLKSDPTDAAKTIAQRFMRRDLAPKDRPILEEFERTRRRFEAR